MGEEFPSVPPSIPAADSIIRVASILRGGTPGLRQFCGEAPRGCVNSAGMVAAPSTEPRNRCVSYHP